MSEEDVIAVVLTRTKYTPDTTEAIRIGPAVTSREALPVGRKKWASPQQTTARYATTLGRLILFSLATCQPKCNIVQGQHPFKAQSYSSPEALLG
jgi:hypothetical protein